MLYLKVFQIQLYGQFVPSRKYIIERVVINMQANTFDVISKRKECVYKTHMSPKIGAGAHVRKMKVISAGISFLRFPPLRHYLSSLGDLAARKRQIELNDSSSVEEHMQVNTFDVIERRKRITFFKLGKLWVFKQFFDNRTLFDALLDYYNKDQYRFEFKSTGARNNALKLLERNGLDYDLVENLKGYVVELPKSARYAQILKNSVAFRETANEWTFLMKDLAAVEEAVGLGAK